MTVRTVLSILDVNNFKEDLKAVANFCEVRRAHLHALIVSFALGPVIYETHTISSIWIDERQREMDELAGKTREAKEILRASTPSYGVESLYTEYGWAGGDFARRGLYTDLVLVGQ